MTGIAVQGVLDIMALCEAGTSSLCVNGSVDMMGALTGLGGSTYRNYAPYADAEEGEFDWGGFARNLVMGLAVGAACIAMSLLLPGIGTIAAGALMGAGMGAISATVAGAASDYSSGNVRSTEEAIRDVAVSMVSGALTGAITGGLGAKLASAFPKAAKVVEKIPLADWAKVGLFNTGDGILGRLVYAVADGNMTVEEMRAYVFSPGYMGMDFLGGVTMYGMSKAVPKVREKLPWNKISNEGGAKTKILGLSEAEEMAFDAIYGPNNADAVVLGKYGDGGHGAYTNVAKEMDAQFFQLDNWNELVDVYSNDEIWKINERFLDIQTSSGREIYLSHDPAEYIMRSDFYSRELNYLVENGYTFVKEGDIWHAIR